MEAEWVIVGLLSLVVMLLAYIGDMLKTNLANIMIEIHELRLTASAHKEHDDKRFAVIDQRLTGLGG